MRSSFRNPWTEVIVKQMWIVWRTNDVVARSINPVLLLDPRTRTDNCLAPNDERLNPLEFHGKRRSPAR